MTDMDYIFRAVEASGLEWVTQKLGGGEKVVLVDHGYRTENEVVYDLWNPLENDADALELAGRLGIVVQDTQGGAIATCIDIDGTSGKGYLLEGGRASARRFAIVQCAASAYLRGAA